MKLFVYNEIDGFISCRIKSNDCSGLDKIKKNLSQKKIKKNKNDLIIGVDAIKQLNIHQIGLNLHIVKVSIQSMRNCKQCSEYIYIIVE